MPMIGILLDGTEASQQGNLDKLRDGLRAHGYVDGRNIRLEYRFADGQSDRLPALADELVRLGPSVLVSSPLQANLAVRNATGTIPIVMANGADPVGFGLVKSLSHPGGNVTGLTNYADELASKQIDLMRDLIPRLSRLAVIVNVGNPLHMPQWRDTQAAAEKVAVALSRFDVRSPTELETAFMAIDRERPNALLVPPDTLFSTLRQRIAAWAAAAGIPAIYGFRAHVEVGGLMSYGINIPENFRRAATYVDKIIKGAKPADLPVEQPTKIELVINLKTAKALGLEIPPILLARADEVIE
jgi:putative ABC transport system substrate-binding protein